MARIQSFLASTANKVTDTANRVADTANRVADAADSAAKGLGASEGAKGASEALIESTIGQDRWEDAADSLADGFQEKKADAQAKADEVRNAVVGQAASEVSEGLAKVAQWFEPGKQALESLREVRQDVQSRVREKVESFDPEVVKEAMQQASSEAVDLAGQIQEEIDGLDSVPTELRSKRNEVLNAIADVCADVVIEQREAVVASGDAIQEVAAALDNMPLFGAERDGVAERLVDTLFPGAHAGATMARWGIEATGHTMKESVVVAEYFKETPGLPTIDNIGLWIDHIEPGERLLVEGQFLARAAAGAGAEGRVSHGVTLARSAEDPNQVSLTMATKGNVGVGVGAAAQDKGVTGMAGAGSTTELRFAFDMSRAEDREMLAKLILDHQTGVATEDAMRVADKWMTSASVTGGVSVATKFDAGLSLNSTGGVTGGYQMDRRAEGTVHQFGVSFNARSSAGASLIDRIPQSVMDGLVDSAPDAEVEMASRALAALSGGHIGTKAELSSSVTPGMEFVDNRLERVFIEARINGSVLGHEGHQVDMEFVIHDPLALASAVGVTAEEFQSQINAGNFDFAEIYQGAELQGLEPSEFMGLTVRVSQNETDGLDASMFGVSFKSLTTRTEEIAHVEFGRPIDRSPLPRPEPLDSKALLYDRIWPG